MKELTILVVASALSGCGFYGTEEWSENVTDLDQAIQNGSTDFSGQEAIRYRTARLDGYRGCSGTVLDSRTVLTARHCVTWEGHPNDEVINIPSLVEVKVDGGTLRPAEAIVAMEPSIEADHDVALVFLSAENALLGPDGRPIFTPLDPTLPGIYLNDTIRISGWGLLTSNSGGGILRHGRMILDDDYVPSFKSGTLLDGILLRTGPSDQNQMPGDSGSPYWGDLRGTIPAGVIGVHCDSGPSANTDIGTQVLAIRNWARSAMSQHHGVAGGVGFTLSFNSTSHLSSGSQYAPDGDPASWSIAGGYLVQNANVPKSYIVWEDHIVRDFVATVEINSPDNDAAGIAFHVVQGQYYFCEANDQHNYLRLASRIGGVDTTLVSTTWNGTFATTKTMTVTGSDNVYRCSFDGRSLFLSHPRIPVGTIGLIQDHNQGVRFNNFSVTGG